ncbi:MAG: anthranilate phosphoribosyltransferase [Verrucomicrobia bacterium]|nr:anthranilate phosphoribosyltransferase [Verrucomicrobiota bacterium]
MLTTFTEQLLRGTALSSEQVSAAVYQLTEELIPTDAKAEFLMALARKGETVEEIAGFARELREKSVRPPLDETVRAGEILDVCGTGGDHLGTFNISTTVALLAAAAGVTVAKHGNRAITSQAGSADVLEALGVKIDVTPEQAAKSLKEHQFAFFFAPKYHPAFKHIAPARKLCAERGQRTIFNLLGPLLNPARPTAQLIGVPKPEFCEPVGRVLQSLGLRRGMVVCGEVSPLSMADPAGRSYLDEISIFGPNTIAEFYHERGFHLSTLNPSDYPVQTARLDDLVGGNSQANAQILRDILSGEDRGPKRDAVLLNAAAALLMAAKVESLIEGWELAALTIDSGKAAEKLEDLISYEPR